MRCPTCGGSGWVTTDHVLRLHLEDAAHASGRADCPRCNADGYVDLSWLADDDGGTAGVATQVTPDNCPVRDGHHKMPVKCAICGLDPDPRRLAAARAVAEWNLGSRAWADRIIAAYLNPAQAMHDLKEEMAG